LDGAECFKYLHEEFFLRLEKFFISYGLARVGKPDFYFVSLRATAVYPGVVEVAANFPDYHVAVFVLGHVAFPALSVVQFPAASPCLAVSLCLVVFLPHPEVSGRSACLLVAWQAPAVCVFLHVPSPSSQSKIIQFKPVSVCAF
jgi:hypothetical protein